MTGPEGPRKKGQSTSHPPQPQLLKLASYRFISSISAKVGALSRMRGRDDGRQTDRSMQEVDLTSQGQVSARQGREPKAENQSEVQRSENRDAGCVISNSHPSSDRTI